MLKFKESCSGTVTVRWKREKLEPVFNAVVLNISNAVTHLYSSSSYGHHQPYNYLNYYIHNFNLTTVISHNADRFCPLPLDGGLEEGDNKF